MKEVLVLEKTRLGIGVGLLGSGLYFVGMLDFQALIILAGYVLLFESNEWLKGNAVRVLKIVIGFSLVQPILTLIGGIIDIMNRLFSSSIGWSHNFEIGIIALVAIVKALMLLIYGCKAYKFDSASNKSVNNSANNLVNNSANNFARNSSGNDVEQPQDRNM